MSNLPILQSPVSISLIDFVDSSSELTRKNEISRIRAYETWIQGSGQVLFNADLGEYRDFLLNRGLAPSSVNAHLKSIRGRYRKMMKSNRYRDALYIFANHVATERQTDSPADIFAIVSELEKRIENTIFADHVFAQEILKQDVADDEHGIRLTEIQASQLIRSIPVNLPHGKRDSALIALLICTGLREHEIVALQVDDLRVRFGGALAIRVRKGKGAKQRMIPYGNLEWCLTYVDHWLMYSGISEGLIFRGFWNDHRTLRPNGLTVRQVNRILERYPVQINGQSIVMHPHDLRRTYARIQFNSGMSAEALQQNLGHASYDTTLRYIGTLDADQRKSRSTMQMPHEFD